MKPTKDILKKLYLDDKLTTRQIGSIYEVSKTQILRWLKSYEIDRRPNGRGLAHRGIIGPDKDALEKMVHIEHLPYSEIARIYKVDTTAIPHWLRKCGIKPAKTWDTRRKGKHPMKPTQEQLYEMYVVEKMPLEEIGEIFSVNRHTLEPYLEKFGINIRPAGFPGKRFLCKDGHVVMSSYELKVDDWLSRNNINHICEPTLPFGTLHRSDFLVNNTFIEIWGICNRPDYTARKEWKRAMYKLHNLELIEIGYHAFSRKSNGLWKRKLEPLLALC